MSEPTQKEISISWSGKSAITVTLTTPPSNVEHSGFGLILGPGAGGDEKTVMLTAVANEVAKQGHICARYRAKAPNLVAGTVVAQLASRGASSDTLATSTKKATAATKDKKKKNATTGASSGDSALASDIPVNFVPGLILFSYPLHTADNTKALRDQILLDIPASVSTLFVSGLKDTMCQPALFAKVFKDMKSSSREVVQVQDADHGLGFGSSKPGQSKKEVLIDAITEWTMAFMDETIAGLGKDTSDSKANATVVIRRKAELKKVADEWTIAVSTVA
ncbi:Testis-expressed protein 30 [Mortierella polycephala]|uniref:Testis-expressed protein 30 n=1 Tax=Mortierella polycephala TaxID=41804 RepID=A0A9P6QC46_9FUNG|nr:Testis-expressed protein 30 [Mortierella polycephala]